MTILVGYSPQESGQSALELGAVLARSLDEPLLVATVAALPVPLIESDVDTEYARLIRQWAARSLDHARPLVPADLDVRFEVVEGSSIAAGLTAAAEEYDASVIVLGSSPKGLIGRITLGSVTESLAHGSHRPLALAPRGYVAASDDRIERLTVLFSDADSIASMLEPAHTYAARMDVPVRFTSFIVRPFKREFGFIEPEADDLVVDAWAARMRSELSALVQETVGVDGLADRLVIGDGLTFSEAAGTVHWRDSDLVLVGPASRAPLARVFLGSRASKIVRAVPVPVVLLPNED